MLIRVGDVMLLWYFFFCSVAARPATAAFLDWFWTTNQDVVRNGKPSENTVLITIPYESKTEDQKFIEEALKFTDLMKSSELDLCQHNVVIKIKTSCSSMTEEELAKMSVNLLNCQSAVDGRKIFTCTEEMSLKDCTGPMDSMTWNAYHMMNNRARAVCLAARRSQFQALSEMTVKKLLTTAQEQVSRMAALQHGQEQLEALTAETVGTVREGNIQMMLEQEKLRDTQKSIQNYVAYNLKELTREKALIAAGHRELAEMTQNIKQRLDEANKELLLQSLERSGNHQQLIADLELVQKQAAAIFNKIDESTSRLVAHHRLAAEQYENTLKNLEKINATVGYLTKIFANTHTELQARIDWVQTYLEDSGVELGRISATVGHIAYLLMGMVVSAFLGLPVISRAALALIIPLNILMIFDNRTDLVLDYFQITSFLLVVTVGNVLFNLILGYVSPPKPSKYYVMSGSNSTNGVPPKPEEPSIFVYSFQYLKRLYFATLALVSGTTSYRAADTNNPALNSSFVSSSGQQIDDIDAPEQIIRRRQAPTTPSNMNEEVLRSNVSRWLDSSRFNVRAGTPVSNASIRSTCIGLCRTGRRCKNPSTPGRDYCSKHEAGSSVMS